MKKIYFLFFLFVVFTWTLHAKKVPGVLIYHNRDTVKVTVRIPLLGINLTGIQRKIKCIDSNKVKMKLKPGDVKEIRFTHNYQEYRMRSAFLSKGIQTKADAYLDNVFLKLMVDGELKLYSYYTRKLFHFHSRQGEYNLGITHEYVFQQEEGLLFREYNLKEFWPRLTKIFFTCPQLIKERSSLYYTRENLEGTVVFYNLNCFDEN